MDKQNMLNLEYLDMIRFNKGYKEDMYRGRPLIMLVLPDDFYRYSNSRRYVEEDAFGLGCTIQDYPLFKGKTPLQLIGAWLQSNSDLIIVTLDEYEYEGVFKESNTLLKGRLEKLGG